MKKLLLFIIAGFFIACVSFQNADAQSWNITGNSNATSSSKLGTTNAIPLRLFTNNVERLNINSNGKIGIGISTPPNIFCIKASGTTPAASWISAGIPVFTGFAEGASTELYLSTASNTTDLRPVISCKRSRGTLAAPTKVANGDYISSFTATAYDGGTFLSPAAINFYVDGTPTSGHVPGRISFETGTSRSDRVERLKLLSNGDIAFNSNQLVVTKATGNVSIGTGNLLMGSPSRTIQFATPVVGSAPMMTMFPSGTENPDRMVVAHSSVYSDWGLQYQDAADKFNFLTAGTPVLTVDLGSQRVGIGTNTPTAKLDVLGQTRVFSDDPSGTDVTTPFKIENTVSSTYFPNLTFYAGFNNTYTQLFGTGGGLLVYGASGYQPIAASAFNVSSDITLKKDITHIKAPKDYETYLTQIRAIDAITYRYKDEVAKAGAKTSTSKVREELHVGFSAQSLPATIQTKIAAGPSTNAEMKLGYNLSDMAGLTLIGIKALDAKITTLAQTNEDLKKENEALKSNIEKQQDQINAILNKLDEVQSAQAACCKAAGILSGGNKSGNLVSASLDQNIPNPAANNSTRIGYNIPHGSLKAELTVTDNFGKKVKQVNLNSNGKGVINIDTSSLAPGNYFYTLYVDAKLIETKKMIVTNTAK